MSTDSDSSDDEYLLRSYSPLRKRPRGLDAMERAQAEAAEPEEGWQPQQQQQEQQQQEEEEEEAGATAADPANVQSARSGTGLGRRASSPPLSQSVQDFVWVWTRCGTNRFRWWPGWVKPQTLLICKSESIFLFTDADVVVSADSPRMRFVAPYNEWDKRSERANPVIGARVRKSFVGYGEWEGRVVEAKEGGMVEVEWENESQSGVVWREPLSEQELKNSRVGTTTVVDNVDAAVAKLRAKEQAVLGETGWVRGARGWCKDEKDIPTPDADGEWARAFERAERAYCHAIAREIAYEEMMRYAVHHSAPSPQGVARAAAEAVGKSRLNPACA